MSIARRCALLGTGLFVACAATAAHAAPGIDDFAVEADFRAPSLSPGGTRIAYVTRMDGIRALVMLDLAEQRLKPLMAATVDTFDVAWCRFKTDDRLLCSMRGTAFEDGQPYAVSRLVSVDATSATRPEVLFQGSRKGGAQFHDRILDWQPQDPQRVLIQIAADQYTIFPGVHALDVVTGKLKQVQGSRAPILSWSVDRHGVVRFGAGRDASGLTYITRDSADAPWRTLASWKVGKGEFDVVGIGPIPGTLLVSADHNGRAAIFEMDLTEKNDRQLLFSNVDVDVEEPIYWPTDGRIVGFEFATERRKRRVFDGEAASIYAAIDKALPDTDNSIVDASRDGQQLLIRAESDVRSNDYLLLNRGNMQMARLGIGNPAMSEAVLSPMKPVRIKAPDGAVLPGYLTLPRGAGDRKLPMVVYPHGGPHARDYWGFDDMVQFFASRGYAVLQVNFRGSVGYGHEWYTAGLRNWGTVMVDDITAATRWAVAEGIADPSRLCIVGWSYGGYAALMSAVREPDLYRCVGSIAGVSDLKSLVIQESRFYGGRQVVDHFVGTDSDELKAGSPLRAAEKIKAPVLLVHGDDDIQVMASHSRRMARALDGAGRKHDLVVIEDGNHSLRRFEWRKELLTKLEAFLASHNPAGPK